MGAAGKTHCGQWRNADPDYYGTSRLVCTDRPHFGLWHHNEASGWYWTGTMPPVREWVCRGWVDELNGLCGRFIRSTEDRARVKGWKIGTYKGFRDPLCPQCAKPDPVTAKLCRDLSQSTRSA